MWTAVVRTKTQSKWSYTVVFSFLAISFHETPTKQMTVRTIDSNWLIHDRIQIPV